MDYWASEESVVLGWVNYIQGLGWGYRCNLTMSAEMIITPNIANLKAICIATLSYQHHAS